MPKVLAYGSWPSPLSAELCTAAQHGVGQIVVNGNQITIVESRPQEGGRSVLLEHRNGRWHELVPKTFNLRTRMHEYGGLAYTSDANVMVAVSDDDQCLHRIQGGKTQALTEPSSSRWRYAEPQIDHARSSIIAVAEEHVDGGEPINRIVRVPLSGGKPVTLVEGDDFYAYPRLSPDGQQLAWIAWNHPNMPWDGTTLYVGEITKDGGLGEVKQIAGGINEAIVQPEWQRDHRLIYLSDRNGFWNLFDDKDTCLWQVDADCGGPLWQLGARFYTILHDGRILTSFVRAGCWHLAIVDKGEHRIIDLPFVDISGIQVSGNLAYFRAAASDAPACVVELDLDEFTHKIIYRSGVSPIPESYISKAESFAFDSQGRQTFAHYYPPTNPDCESIDGDKPPLIVLCHGGPTSAASTALRLDRQFWTSRGFAICDVDYGGSSGYGRAYRERLRGQWGVVDVEDCVAAAEHLVEQGKASPDQLIIRGGSAGGFTVLAALTFFKTFKVGASAYGIGDLELLAGDTHKFESRYLDSLIGPYPQAKDLYQSRSPINHIDQLDTPVIFFQGLEDKVVPPNQAERMVDALKAKSIPVAYLAFEGEGHGFRQSQTQIRVLLSELAFYAAILNLKPDGELPSLQIDNL